MVGGRRLPPAFAGTVHLDWAALELRANRTGEHIGEDEAGSGMVVRLRCTAGRIVDDHRGQALPRNIWHDLLEDLASLAAGAGAAGGLAGGVSRQHRHY